MGPPATVPNFRPARCLQVDLLNIARRPRMLSGRLFSRSQRQSLQLCAAAFDNSQLVLQQPVLTGQKGSYQVSIQIPAQQLIATVVTSPTAEEPSAVLPTDDTTSQQASSFTVNQVAGATQSDCQIQHTAQDLQEQIRSRPPHGQQPGWTQPSAASEHMPPSMEPFLLHLRTRGVRPLVWQQSGSFPTSDQLQAAEQELQYPFRDIALLEQAFMAPGAVENNFSNRPLAWFGDAALTMLVMEDIASRLARQNPARLETGEPTLLRDQLVSRETCARNIQKLKLCSLLTVSYAARPTVNQLAELFEAILGAIYLDGGFAEARRIYQHHWPLPDVLVAHAPEH